MGPPAVLRAGVGSGLEKWGLAMWGHPERTENSGTSLAFDQSQTPFFNPSHPFWQVPSWISFTFRTLSHVYHHRPPFPINALPLQILIPAGSQFLVSHKESKF